MKTALNHEAREANLSLWCARCDHPHCGEYTTDGYRVKHNGVWWKLCPFCGSREFRQTAPFLRKSEVKAR